MNLSELKQKIKEGELDYKAEDMAMSSALVFFVVNKCSLQCQSGCSVSRSGKDNPPCSTALRCAEGCAASSCATCVHSCSKGKTIGLF